MCSSRSRSFTQVPCILNSLFFRRDIALRFLIHFLRRKNKENHQTLDSYRETWVREKLTTTRSF